jgi:uncharacterized membrane protein SpoIIM required for sporulation
VRALRWHIALAAFLLALGGFVGYRLCMADVAWYYTFMPDSLASGRSPTASTESLRDTLYSSTTPDKGGYLSAFGSWLFIHNAQIGMMSFALGIALGLPTVWFMISNGLTLGVFVALYAGRGLGYQLGGWLIIHGSTELLAIALCGGAGLALADAVLFADRRNRLTALGERGRLAGTVVLGAICMFLVAGALEGLGRQLINDDTLRYLIGGGMLLAWLLLFLRGGTRPIDDGDQR